MSLDTVMTVVWIWNRQRRHCSGSPYFACIHNVSSYQAANSIARAASRGERHSLTSAVPDKRNDESTSSSEILRFIADATLKRYI